MRDGILQRIVTSGTWAACMAAALWSLGTLLADAPQRGGNAAVKDGAQPSKEPAPAGTTVPPGMQQVQLDGHTFTLPDGFTIERAAGSPLVERPIVADLDERGRLYVADSSGSNEKTDVQLQKKPHRIVRLEDTDGDGRYDRQTVFADKMMFPEGAMWLAGSLYVAAPPHIWKLTDTDDDGVADRRELWFDGKTLTGCANDLHGPYRGPDGWIYWCKGAFAKQTYTLPGGKTLTTRASHIFRARPDGTGIEPVMTGGMDNPVDVAFTPGGERIFTTTFFQHPGGGRRDGLIHAIYGGIYGKDHDPIHEPDHKWTSPQLMPVLTHMGPAAPCGQHRYESDQFGRDAAGVPYRDNLFACQFNLRKVSRHVLRAEGSTFVTEDSDFLVSDNHDFHPTDVIEDADGSLLVLNTGGWYKLCCPSSQLVKADVLGAIYRIKRTGSHRVDDPYGRKFDWKRPPAALVSLLGDGRPMVRRQATQRLAEAGDEAVGVLGKVVADAESTAAAGQSAVWTLCRIDSPAARQAIRSALAHRDEEVGQAALHAISLGRDRDAVKELMPLLSTGSPHQRRLAAEALGRIGDATAVAAILEALAREGNDRGLEHALTYALIEIGDESTISRGLTSSNPRVERAVVVALDQLGSRRLEVAAVLSRLNHPDARLRDVARWIAGRHPEWSSELTGFLRGQLAAKLDEAQQAELIELLARFAKTEVTQRLLADAVRAAGKAPAAGRIALRAMTKAGLKEIPTSWVGALAGAVPDSPVLSDVLATARAVTFPKQGVDALRAALTRLADVEQASPDDRLAALAALPGGASAISPAQWALLLAHLDRDQPVKLRGAAADVLSQARLTTDQLSQLAERLPRVGPLEIDRVLNAFAQSGDGEVGAKLLAALRTQAVRPNLRVDGVQQRLKKYGPAVQKEAEKLYALINADFAQQQAHLNEVAASLPPGDVRRGQAVFNSTKTSCLACHNIGYVGGRIGPDLTRIGGIRTQRDLLESILYPSASFVRSYEPLAVLTTDGRTFSGIAKVDAADEIVLIEAADKEVRIARRDVEAVQPGKISIMPAGLDKQLSVQELADLVAFLQACR